jgi:hypothetical protein
MVVNTIADRNALPQMYRYEGLTVYVKSDSSNYQLMSGLSNSDWRAIGCVQTNTVTISQGGCSKTPTQDYQLCISSNGKGNYDVYISYGKQWIKLK